jgi:hypothetical protein
MPSDIDPQLEAFIHDRLRQLPPHAAPRTLVPRVRAAIQASADHAWWLRPWWQWPLAAKAALVLIALASLAVVSAGSALLGDGFRTYGPRVAERVGALANWWGGVATHFDGPSLYWQQYVEPLLVPALLGALALYLVSMGCGTALVRLAWKRA